MRLVCHERNLLCCGLILLQEADRLKCATSVIHQADQACRRLISDAMKTARGELFASFKQHTTCTQFICNPMKCWFCLPNFRESSSSWAHEVSGCSAEWIQSNVSTQPAGAAASGRVIHWRRGHWCGTCGEKSCGCFWSGEKGNPVESLEWK